MYYLQSIISTFYFAIYMGLNWSGLDEEAAT